MRGFGRQWRGRAQRQRADDGRHRSSDGRVRGDREHRRPQPTSRAGLVYRSAAGTSDVVLATVPDGTTLAVGAFYLFGGAGYVSGPAADQSYSISIAATGGGVGIRDAGGALVDSVGWGTATNVLVEGTAPRRRPSAAGTSTTDSGRRRHERQLGGLRDRRDADHRRSPTARARCPSPRARALEGPSPCQSSARVLMGIEVVVRVHGVVVEEQRGLRADFAANVTAWRTDGGPAIRPAYSSSVYWASGGGAWRPRRWEQISRSSTSPAPGRELARDRG